MDDEHSVCKDRKLTSACTVPQDDGTCTYMTTSPCLCGNKVTATTCYQVDGKCGAYGTTTQDCTDLLTNIKNTTKQNIEYIGCRPTGEEQLLDPDQCRKANTITKVYVGTIGNLQEKYQCSGSSTEESGCIDPQAKNYNQYATIPKKCEY